MRTPNPMRASILCATAILSGLALAGGAVPSVPSAPASALADYGYTTLLDDAAVRLTEHTLQPGKSEPLRHDDCRVIYSISNQTVTQTFAGGTAQDQVHKFRSAWWRPAEDSALTNRGLQPVKEVIVSFKQPLPGVRGCTGTPLPRVDLAASDLDAMRAAPQFYKVVYENAAIRVMESNVPAGTATPSHLLRCALSYALTDQSVRITHDDGRSEDVHRGMALPWWSPAQGLALGNLGAKNAFSLVVEFKHKGVGDASCPPVAGQK